MKKALLLVGMFCLSLLIGTAWAQQRTVTGKVTSEENGEPLPGVNVVVKGTNSGTVTNLDGEYSLNVPNEGTTLVFSFIGLETREVPVGNQSVINLQMASDVRQLGEVVVTALGIERDKASLGYAVQEIESEQLVRAGNTDMVRSLQGKVAGVDIKVSSGMPGASSQIVMRGARSFEGNNTPLYVIDGMPIESNAYYTTGNGVTGADIANRAVDINPNDIETINVLKGQAAAALYGLRASNGVIVITTKSGKGISGGKPVISFSQTTSWDQVSRTPDYQTTWAQGSGGTYSPNSSMSWGPKITDLPNDPTYGGNENDHPGLYRVPQLEAAGLDPWVQPNVYNNWDDYFQIGRTSTTSLNVAQGSENGSFAIGLGYTDQTGVALNTGLKRWNGKFSGERKLNSNFTTGFSTNLSSTTIDKLSGANDGSLTGPLAAPSSYNLKGIPYHAPGDPYTQIYYRGGSFDNAYWVEHNNTFNEKTYRMFGNGFVNYTTNFTDVMKLSIKYQLGIDNYNSHYQDIFGYGTNGASSVNNYGVSAIAYNSLLTATYDWGFTDDFNLNVILGNEFIHNNEKTYDEFGQGIIFGGWNHVDNVSTTSATEDQYQDRTVGVFGNLSLAWKDMIFLGATGRKDVVSYMPRGARSFFYPSVSLGIVLSEIPALQDLSWLDYAKIRGSYAEVGQGRRYMENYYYKPTYGSGFWSGQPIIYPVNGVNSYIQYFIQYDPNLRPQNTKSYEIGVNLEFFNRRVGLDYNFSNQHVVDQIFEVPLAGSTGVSSLVTNGGEVFTDAHEVVLTLVPISTRDFRWDFNINYTKIKNMVEELAPGVESIFLGGFVTPQLRAGIGYNYPVIYGTQFVRNDKGQILVNEDPNAAGYGMPMAGEPGIIGSVSPDFILGGTTNLSYKNISLSAVLEWKNGGQMYSGSNGLLDLYGMSARTEDRESTFIYEGYKADGSPNDIARGGITDPRAYQTLFSDVLGNIDEHYIHGNSFVKLRELSLRYTLPESLTKSVGVAISAFTRNILLWTELDNLDPESSQGNDNMMGGFERFSLPQTSSYGIGLEVKF